MINNERDLKILKELILSDYTSCIQKEYGNDGIENLKVVLETIKNIFKFLHLPKFSSVIIFKSDSYHLLDCENIQNFSHLGSFKCDTLVIQIKNLTEISVSSSEVNISEIVQTDFVYQYTPKKEMFHIKSSPPCELPKFSGSESYFTISTFKSLNEALTHYKTTVVRYADCPTIKQALYPNRIFFKPKPEYWLRDSMVFFLKARLRGEGLEVRPEQIVDTSHPVDVKVTWGFTNHIALIEIKWLGKSFNSSSRAITSIYTDSRAIDGAKQLAEYLDANISQVPNHNTMGYLVVFDLRRRSTTSDTTQISYEDGFWYENKEIKYEPKYDRIRNDFAPPIRMFITPKLESDEN